MTRTAFPMMAVFAAACAAPQPPAAEPTTPLVEFLNANPASNLPFSDAVRVGNLLFLSGKVGNVPGTLDLAPGGLEGQARQAMENIKTTLTTHGYAMRDVVKCTVMLADISKWGAFNEIYTSFFEAPYPARSAFGANGLALGAELEVECIAAKGS